MSEYAGTIPTWLDYKPDGTPIFTSQKLRTRRGMKPKYGPEYFGGLIEPARTNLLYPSAAPVVQNITVTAQPYTISCIGAGSLTLSGAATGVATAAAPLTVTPTAGTLTVTPSGALTHGQVEVGSFKTSPIVSVSGTVTRPAGNWTVNSAGILRANSMGIAIRVIPEGTGQTGVIWSSRVDASNYSQISATPTTIIFSKTIAGVTTSLVGTYSHTAGVPFIVMAHQDPSGGMSARVKQDGGAWSSYATNAGVADMPIGATFQIGALNNASHFAAGYAFVEPFWGSLAKFEGVV